MSHHASFQLSPDLFDERHITPATRAFNAQLEKLLASIPSILQRPAAVIREERASGKSILGPVVLSPKGEERSLATPAGTLPLRVFPTPAARGVLLHLH